jgi:hypothetical protein
MCCHVLLRHERRHDLDAQVATLATSCEVLKPSKKCRKGTHALEPRLDHGLDRRKGPPRADRGPNGPSRMPTGLMIHPMYLHGLPQKVIARDGRLLKRPYTGDTILVAPGERVDVLVKADAPGPWAPHCHILNHAESTQGMFGMVTAMVVE